ncbi:type I secretion system permease/ATPase [Azoarcus indigens]|uniref:Cyclolysin secretion/processing ATP-binding protein CyaB n=1 Tax=Azoarcus indigens TaxID=29545 RepID=A0A4R6E169_9RHOO|nr:type I secretion system permease/ATPase [Azoarcus indigens]NMG64981.1 type I secretion system permease/ATPase [Azoarcus indigens]TDN50518.1 HlyB family type I secretion system ABC transporter [Azoarcus indigens]
MNTLQPASGLACLAMLSRLHGVAADTEALLHRHGAADGSFPLSAVLLAAKELGLKAKHGRFRPAALTTTPLPAIACDRNGGFFILARIDSGTDARNDALGTAPVPERCVLIQDPASGRPQILPEAEFLARWDGTLVLLASRASLAAELARFDFSWFIPAIVKYRRLLGEVLVASFFLQLFALVTPLFFQVVMDKVLVHKGYATLTVIGIGLVAVNLFESLLSALRTYLFAHTSSRIDVELGARLFRHLLNLPLAYFEARRVGDSVARVRELENIRQFLTGQALTLVLDLFFSIVFIAVMAWYSIWLTLVVLATLPIYAALSIGITPILRGRLNEKFQRSADNQAFLVESVSNIHTVKAMAVEPQFTRHWDNQLAGYVAAGFRVTRLGAWAAESVGLIGKLTTVAILWLGAYQVIDGALTVGGLIAFNMLAGRVSQPIMRLANLWQDFQQTGISMARLGDILNTRTELPASRAALPAMQGRIEFEHVRFRYRADGAEILKGVSFTIAPGDVIGIVGRSGSGKSTLTKLIQRLYVPERGRVLVDGVDLALADPVWLRRQTGVVLQENMLFARSIRDNIALTDPGAPLENVIAAAKLAGAHDFIMQLPQAYDTPVGEHGATLSGGQRQRIAIARALLTNPRILILDEATSALDYESERIIQDNMRDICRGRTVIIIAHRLSAVKDANRILVMDHGELIEEGHHGELKERPNGTYAKLYALQQA